MPSAGVPLARRNTRHAYTLLMRLRKALYSTDPTARKAPALSHSASLAFSPGTTALGQHSRSSRICVRGRVQPPASSRLRHTFLSIPKFVVRLQTVITGMKLLGRQKLGVGGGCHLQTILAFFCALADRATSGQSYVRIVNRSLLPNCNYASLNLHLRISQILALTIHNQPIIIAVVS